MPGRRSASPDGREHKRSRKDRDRERDRSRSPPSRTRERDEEDDSRHVQTIPSLSSLGLKALDIEADYFLKAAEFRLWLKEEKGKYFDELSGESSRKWFKKFCKRWNKLTLPKQYYTSQTTTSAPSSSLTNYKWSFVNNRSRVDKDELSRVREDVDRLTHAGAGTGSSVSSSSAAGPGPSSSSRVMGPAMGPPGRVLGPSAFPPSTLFSASHTDRQLQLEQSREAESRERRNDRKREYNRVNEEVVPKSGGREGKMEERRATNAENRQYRDRDAGAGLEVDEGTLMGAEGGFAAAKARRDAADARRLEQRSLHQADKRAAAGDRFAEMKSKDQANLEMFKEMARARFGTGS